MYNRPVETPAESRYRGILRCEYAPLSLPPSKEKCLTPSGLSDGAAGGASGVVTIPPRPRDVRAAFTRAIYVAIANVPADLILSIVLYRRVVCAPRW